jgi:hypothetical protein
MHQVQLHMMLAVAAQEEDELRQFDIRTAFLNGPLQEEVYLRPPAGLEGLAGRGSKVLRLQRALYGLQQASAWNKRLEAELTRKSLVQSDADPALWILHVEGGAVLAMSYVDDGVVEANAVEQADALVVLVASMFAIRALGEPEDFLGIQIFGTGLWAPSASSKSTRPWSWQQGWVWGRPGSLCLCHLRRPLDCELRRRGKAW